MTLPQNNLHEAITGDDTPVTPHELAQKQISDPDYHVTDEDMDKMEITDELTDEEVLEANEEADAMESDKAGTSYDVLD